MTAMYANVYITYINKAKKRSTMRVVYTKPDIPGALDNQQFVEDYCVARASGVKRDMEMVMYRYFGTISSDDEYRLTCALDREENVRKRVYELYQASKPAPKPSI
jgi:hypothetical protein